MRNYYISALISGLIYATFMAGYDFFTHEPFSIIKYLFHAIFFGGGLTFLNYRANRNLIKNEESKFDNHK